MTFPPFPSLPEEVRDNGWHASTCPGCGSTTLPYDDDPWPEGHEWTSAYDCTHCEMTWTHPWQYPSGLPYS